LAWLLKIFASKTKLIMKNVIILCTLCAFLSSCSKEQVDFQQTNNIQRVPNSTKKGLGLSESRYGAEQLDSLGVSWYYSWGFTTGVRTTKTFIPMVFSLNTLSRITPNQTILGFNEPDNASQSNIAVSNALSNWSPLVNNSVRLGSPGTAGNPLTTGSWLSQFMASNPKVDFITVHWYKGVNSTLFINDMKAIITKWKKPIWITEFAPQTISSSTSNPTKYSQTQVNAFINTVVHWMETEPMVEKYAFHDSRTGTSALFTTTGKLTPTGIAYRDSY